MRFYESWSHFIFSVIILIAYSQVESHCCIKSVPMILSISFDVKWSNILIENYQFVRNYVKEKGTSKIFPRKCKCKKKRERRGSKKGWFYGFVWWKSYAQGMPRGLIRKRLDWFDSKANNATSRAWWNSEGCGRD